MANQLINDKLVLISGKSTTGKSASLRTIADPKGVAFCNCEAGKKLPFRLPSDNRFKEFTIVDPFQVIEVFQAAEDKPEIHTIIIDTLTYLMDMFETVYVNNSDNTMKAWGDYQQYFKKLMQQHVAASSKNVIFLAHTADVLNESEMVVETMVPVKGALKKNGIESFFSTVISTKRLTLKQLEDYKSPLLNISEQEELLGYKYVYQTQQTKETVNERIRAPMGMWEQQETFIDNDVQLVLDRLNDYYS